MLDDDTQNQIQKAHDCFQEIIDNPNCSEVEQSLAQGGMALNTVASSLCLEHEKDRATNLTEHQELKTLLLGINEKIDPIIRNSEDWQAVMRIASKLKSSMIWLVAVTSGVGVLIASIRVIVQN
jgi:hypothetical protein